MNLRQWMFPATPTDQRVNIALLLFRVVIGLAMMSHGWGKIQNPFGWMPATSGMPGFLQALAAISEFFGGLAWVMGALTRLSSLGIGCTMLVATLMHYVNDDPFSKIELPMSYFLVAVFLAMMGSGLYGFDALYAEPGDTTKPSRDLA